MPGPLETVAELVERAIVAYESLVTVAEEIADEWQYISDLSGAWRARMREASSASPASPESAAAVDAVAVEMALIVDPHRAIDWLSSYPQLVLIALGVRP
jgi:hypothetical protein